MNRFIIGRLALVSFLAAVFAAGCAFEQASGGDEDQTEHGDEGSRRAGYGTSVDEQTSAGEGPMLKHSSDPRNPDNSVCAGCGPLPDPWKKMGPLPDPWTSSSGGSTSSGGSNSDGKSK